MKKESFNENINSKKLNETYRCLQNLIDKGAEIKENEVYHQIDLVLIDLQKDNNDKLF